MAPDVVGVTESAARDQLAPLGLSVRVVQVPSDEPSGIVVSQSPASASKVAKNATVRLNVSKGRTISVPDTEGLAEQEARSQLASLGFEARIVQQVSNQPAGTVVSQSPAAGSNVSKGGTVTLTVSKGTGLVDVPDVVGLSRSEAETTLRNAGLRAGSVIKVPSDEPVGTVVAQYPRPGQQRKNNAPVQINVSNGRP